MRCKSLLIALVASAVLSVTAWSEDISGEWTGEMMVGRYGMIAKAVYEFKVEDTKLTGSVLGYPETERPIFDGKVKGDKISFSLKEYFGDRSVTYNYKGEISGDTIKFRVVTLDATGRHMEFTATKVR